MRTPSLPGYRMPRLHRLHAAAMQHDYRIGLQILNDNAYLLYARDLTRRRGILITTGRDIEYLATVMYARLLAGEYISREPEQPEGA